MKKRVLSAMPSQTFAEGALDAAQQTGKLSYDGYKEVWHDEFDGNSLNRADWNVETHEKGWVNNELQEYVDSDENIQVKDGKLIIYNYKKIVVNFNDVKDIKYIPYMGPSGKYNIFGIGWRTTGQIVIYLHNNKKIYVSDIKKVSTACVDLRKIVLDIAD